MKNRRGQGLIEYLILVSLVAVTSIAVLSVVGTNIKERYANISNSLRGKGEVSATDVKKSAYQKRGMDDYMESGKGD